MSYLRVPQHENKRVCVRSLDVFRFRCSWVNLRTHGNANVAKRVDVMPSTKLISHIIWTQTIEAAAGGDGPSPRSPDGNIL
jgi:hypothetical protein